VSLNLSVTVSLRWWVRPALYLAWVAACFGWYGPADRWISAVARRGCVIKEVR